MLPGFGKQTITIGSAPHCDIHLPDPGVAPIHARIVNQGGQLVFVDEGTGQTFANWQPIAPGSIHPFDFRTPFMVGQAQVPNTHPAIVLMLMQHGKLASASRADRDRRRRDAGPCRDPACERVQRSRHDRRGRPQCDRPRLERRDMAAWTTAWCPVRRRACHPMRCSSSARSRCRSRWS